MKSDLEKRFENILEEEKPVSGIYNKPFIVGVLFVIAFFIVSNSISYFISYNNYLKILNKRANSKIQFSGIVDYYWGFPFEFCRNTFDCSPEGIVSTTAIMVFCSFFFGFLFKFIWSKISYRFVSVK
jgi:hypothetical protein